ncbi:MAG: hypothetical protein IJQ24_00835, partial [Synergistaceae bacterium]|nr:hypothetical protein [Synergistaceae bacterium]
MKKVRKGFMFRVCILALSLTIAGIAFASGKGIVHFKGDCQWVHCKCTEFWCKDGYITVCYNCGHVV